MSVFHAAALVTAEEAARLYGVQFSGKRAFCPFHDDGAHPALSFKGGRFRCFACGEAGDSIDFTQAVLHVTNLEAARRLNADFGLGLSEDPADETVLLERRRAQETKRRRAEVVTGAHDVLCWAWRYLHAQSPATWEDITGMHALLLKYKAETGMILDALERLPMAERYDLILMHKKVVDKLDNARSIAQGARQPMLGDHQRGLRNG